MKVSTYLQPRNWFALTMLASLSMTACGGGSIGSHASSIPSLQTQSVASSTVLASALSQSGAAPNNIDVYFSNTIQQSAVIPDDFVGLSFEKRDLSDGKFTSTDQALVSLFRSLRQGTMRLGGDSGEDQVWCPASSTSACPKRGSLNEDTLTSLNSFLSATGWKVIYMLPLKDAVQQYQIDTGSDPAHKTAQSQINLDAEFAAVKAEAQSAAKILGPNLLSFEIGNEPDFYTDSQGHEIPASYYMPVWNQWATRLKEAVPNAHLMSPSTAGYVNNPISHQNWIAGESTTVSLVSQHYYAISGHSTASTSSMINQLLDPGINDNLVNDIAALKTQSGGTPYRIAETNTVSIGGKDGVSNVYASAFWAIDALFTIAQNGGAGANFHSSGDSTTYAPIAGSTAQPEYYGLLFFNQAAVGGRLVGTTITNPVPYSEAQAIYINGNTENVVIQNKNANSRLYARIFLPTLANANTPYKATVTMLNASSAQSTSDITFGGIAMPTNATWQSQVPNPLQLNPAPLAHPNSTDSWSVGVFIPPMSAGIVTITH